VTKRIKSGQTTAFRSIGIHGKLVKVATALVDHMVGATGNRPPGPFIVNIEGKWGVNADLRM
jgi:hypothetical protein